MPIMMKRIGFIALGIVLVGSLSRAPVFAADKPVADGSKIMITSPKDGDKVGDSFELKYELVKGSQAGHVHVYVDNEYQRGFKGKLKGLSKGGAPDYRESCQRRSRKCGGHPYHHRRRTVILQVIIFKATRASCERGPGATGSHTVSNPQI